MLGRVWPSAAVRVYVCTTLSVVVGAVWHSLLPDDPSTSLTALGVAHGDLLFMAYDMERQVEPAYKPGPLDSNRPFGSHVTVSDHNQY